MYCIVTSIFILDSLLFLNTYFDDKWLVYQRVDLEYWGYSSARNDAGCMTYNVSLLRYSGTLRVPSCLVMLLYPGL